MCLASQKKYVKPMVPSVLPPEICSFSLLWNKGVLTQHEERVQPRKTFSNLPRVDTKWRLKFFEKYDYRFQLVLIIAITATFWGLSDYRYFTIIAKYFTLAIIVVIEIMTNHYGN